MANALFIDAIKRRPAVESEPRDPGRVRLDLSAWDFGDPHAAPGYTFVDKLVAKNEGWDHAYAERVVEEFRRFVILWAYYPGASHVPSQAVDEAWHLAILFTQRYATMCQRFFGRFKHHNPSSSDRERVTLRGGYGHTLAQYEEVFGEDPPTDIWPAPRQCARRSGLRHSGLRPRLREQGLSPGAATPPATSATVKVTSAAEQSA